MFRMRNRQHSHLPHQKYIDWSTGEISGITDRSDTVAIFSNQATLTYNGNTTNSNIAYGEILDALSATKTAIEDTYTPDELVTYVVTLRNTSSAALTNHYG